MRGAPLKSKGILAAEDRCFNQQCDCFVMKRYMLTDVGLKEVMIRFWVVNDRLQNWWRVCDTKTQHGQYEVRSWKIRAKWTKF